MAPRLPRRGWWSLVAAIAVVGFAARLLIVLRGGGLLGVGGYDDGVYYAAADALVHGRLPYRDFLFIQPPGIAVAIAPFALLGAHTADPAGMAAARLAFMAVGGADAALAAVLLRRFGRTAALIGGLFLAVFAPSVYAERSTLLEPLGSLAMLLGLALVARAARDPRMFLAAGFVLGLGVGVKIWYVVPMLVVVAFARHGRARVLLGAVAGGAAIFLPFLAAAPAAGLRQIVLDQLGRPVTTSVGRRIETILGASSTAGHRVAAVAVVLLVLTAGAAALAAGAGARSFVVLLAADGLVLLAAPSFYPHYADLTAPPLALVAGVAAARVASLPRRPAARATLVALLILGIGAVNLRGDLRATGTRVPSAALRVAAGRIHGCITSDDPTILAVADVLTRDLAQRGCVVWPDVTGWTYDADAERAGSRAVARSKNLRWQGDVLRYLRSGTATIVIRKATGLSAASKRALAGGPTLFRSGRWVLRSTAR